MLVPFGAGGGTDVPARFFAAETEKILGKNIVVSNVEGAGGTVGAGLIFVGGVQIYPFGSLFGVNGVHFGFFFGDDG